MPRSSTLRGNPLLSLCCGQRVCPVNTTARRRPWTCYLEHKSVSWYLPFVFNAYVRWLYVNRHISASTRMRGQSSLSDASRAVTVIYGLAGPGDIDAYHEAAVDDDEGDL